LIGLIIIFILADHIFIVSKYEGYYHRAIETVANFTEIGLVEMKEMGTIPYFSVHYKGHRLKREDKKHCKETDNDCFKLAKKYLDI
jgi:hypothetical protein